MVWERILQRKTWVRVSVKAIAVPMRRPGEQLIRNGKEGDTNAVVQAIISGLCVPDGLGMQMCSHGYMGNFSSLRILAAPNSLVAFSWKGIGLFSTLVVPQNRDSRDGSGPGCLEYPAKC